MSNVLLPPIEVPSDASMARLFERDVVPGMVSAASVDLLGRYLEKQGIDRYEVIPRHDQWACGEHADRYPAEAFCRLLLLAAQRLQDPCMGFHMGQGANLSLLGALGYGLMACENLGAALLFLQRSSRLIQDINPLRPPSFIDGNLVLEWVIVQGRPGALFDELGITGMVKMAREMCRDPVDPAAIDFVNPPPRDIAPYLAFFRCPVRFAQPSNRILIPMSALQMPLNRSDPTLLKLMSQHVDKALSHLSVDEDLAVSTRRVIANMAAKGIPELEQVASVLSLTPKMLYRRLTEEGLNFRTLREDVLKHLAETHLRDAHLTLSEVSARLGYAEQSAFTRAFKRWTGVTPIQWRSRLAPPDSSG